MSQRADLLTYVVVAILDQECDSLAIEVLLARSYGQVVAGAAHITKQLTILEGAAGEGVDDGLGVGIMVCDGFEER